MRTTAQRWGNSLAVRIPKALAGEASLEEGQEVEITLEDRRLVITPVRSEPEYSLDTLLAGVTPENLHGETDFGPPAGQERL